MKAPLNRFFRYFATVLAVFYAVAAVASLQVAAAQQGVFLPSAPREVPEYGYVDQAGTPVSGEVHLGKVVILHFWAKWCPPCIEELPQMVEMIDGIDAERKADLVVLPISLDRDAATVQNFLKENDIRLPVLRDEGSKAMRAFGIKGLPSTILIGRDGKEIARREGVVNWQSPAVRGLILDTLSPLKPVQRAPKAVE